MSISLFLSANDDTFPRKSLPFVLRADVVSAAILDAVISNLGEPTTLFPYSDADAFGWFHRSIQRESYKLEAVAQDRGFPPLSRTVEVQIDVVDRANNPPIWDQVVYGPIYVKENKNVGDKVVSIKARSVSSARSKHKSNEPTN